MAGQFITDSKGNKISIPKGIPPEEILKMVRANPELFPDNTPTATTPVAPNADPRLFPDNTGTPLAQRSPADLVPTAGSVAPSEPPWSITDYMASTEGKEMTGNMGGSLLGTGVGAIGGPVGMSIGSSVGGGIGSFVGTIYGQLSNKEDLDIAAGIQAAGVSMGIDLATAGTNNFAIKPLWLRTKKALGYTDNEIVSQLTKQIDESQSLVMENGGTLTPFQVGQVKGSRLFGQQIAEMGIISRNTMQENANKVNGAVQNSINALISSVTTGRGVSHEDLGTAMAQIISEGKNALSTVYGKNMDEVAALTGRQAVPSGRLVSTLEGFLKSRNNPVYNDKTGDFISNLSSLDPDTVSFIKDQLKAFKGGSLNMTQLLTIQRNFAKEIDKAGAFGSTLQNTAKERELGILFSEVQEAVRKSATNIDPEAGTLLKQANKAYADGLNNMLPDINKSYVALAGKEDYTSLGKAILTSNNESSIVAFQKTIKTAFEERQKAGVPFRTEGINSYEDAVKYMQEGFLVHQFPDTKGVFSIEKYKKLAEAARTPTEKARLKAVLGDNYNRYRIILNTMETATDKPTGFLAALVLRSKEMTAAAGLLAAGSGAMDPTDIPSLLFGAATFLTLPSFLAKVTTNPKAMQKLIELRKHEVVAGANGKKQMVYLLNDLLKTTGFEDMFSDEEIEAEVMAVQER